MSYLFKRSMLALISVVILVGLWMPVSRPGVLAASANDAEDTGRGVSASIVIHPAQVVAKVTSLQRGSNAPLWLGDNYSNPVFRARTKYSGVGLVRIPGGSYSDMYGWLSCENRVFQQGTAYQCGGNGEDWSSWAARPTDFINFLRATGKQGMFIINVNATAQEAAAAVAFFNAQPGDPTVIGVDRNGFDWQTAGVWAQLRADHGNPSPFIIKYWEIGNEVYGGKPSTGGADCMSWGWENAWTCDGVAYVNGDATHDGYQQMRAAMQAVDASILVGAVGFEDPTGYNNWGNEVIQQAGGFMDFYIVHPYAYDTLPPLTRAGWMQVLAQPRKKWSAMKATLQTAFDTYAGGRQIPIAASEFNVVAVQENDPNQMMNRAGDMLFVAESLGQAIRNGYLTVNQWDLANGCSNVTGTCYDLLQVDFGFRRSPQYFAFPLWARFGATMLGVNSTLNPSTTLSVYAGRINATTYSLLAINKTGANLPASVRFDNGLRIGSARADVARAASLNATSVTYNGKTTLSNNLGNAPSLPVSQVGATMKYTFPPYSITLLRMKVGPQADLAMFIALSQSKKRLSGDRPATAVSPSALNLRSGQR